MWRHGTTIGSIINITVGVSEPLGEGVGLNLELGDALVLVGGDRGELGLGEHKCSELLLLNIRHRSRVSISSEDKVDPGLELVHRVEQQLQLDRVRNDKIR